MKVALKAERCLLSVVVPMYNEEEVIETTYRRLAAVLESIGEPYEILFVDDGSRDRTADIVRGICAADRRVKLVGLSRNFGHQIAVTAGIDHASGRCVVLIDADLQDPPEIIPQMLARWREGFDVVYGRRVARKGESWFKKTTAALFYRFLRKMSPVDIPVDTGDFRLMDRKVCDALRGMRERSRFVRGMVSWVGYRQTAVPYVREERFCGRDEISAAQNGPSVAGRHHVVFHPAAPVGGLPRFSLVGGRVCVPAGGVVPAPVHRRDAAGLDVADRHQPAVSRHHADAAGRPRRVCGADLRGDQGTSALSHGGKNQFRRRRRGREGGSV